MFANKIDPGHKSQSEDYEPRANFWSGMVCASCFPFITCQVNWRYCSIRFHKTNMYIFFRKGVNLSEK